MTSTTAPKFTVRTATGTVHRMTEGRTWKSYGETCANRSDSQIGTADCGAKTSSAARITTEAVTCPKCLAR